MVNNFCPDGSGLFQDDNAPIHGPLNPLEGKVNANKYTAILSDHLEPMVNNFCPDGSGLFQDDNAPIH
ncbi:unnamed protein product, partial [Coregonus sp. 'balchen']